MIKLIRHGNNETEITNGKTPRQSVFFSYSTPVAGLDLKGFFKTSKKYSMTTTKHINKMVRVLGGIWGYWLSKKKVSF